MRAVLSAALVLALAACATEPRREFRHGGGPPRGEARGRAPLFISPTGEPFRGPDGLARWFAGADADRDGALTAAEFQADADRFFRTLDVNGDGVIDGFEMQAYEQTIAPEVASLEIESRIGGRRPGFGRGGGPGREGAARYSLINEPEPVANADANVDGRVSAQEWRRATERRFQSLDKAKTGRLTLEALRGKTPPKPPPKREGR